MELVNGYGIYVAKKALEDAVDSSRKNPTRLVRNLVSIFFTEEELSKSNACGRGNKHIPLDPDILGACYRKLTYAIYTYVATDIPFTGFVTEKHNGVSKPELVNAVNDVCCNARRKLKKMNKQ